MGRGGFSANWGSFSQANYLELHDVCMFELIQPNKFRVHIFRVVEELTLSVCSISFKTCYLIVYLFIYNVTCS